MTRHLSREVAAGLPGETDHPGLEEDIASGTLDETARDVDQELERISRMLSDGRITIQDLANTYPAMMDYVQDNNLETEVFGEEYEGLFDPLAEPETEIPYIDEHQNVVMSDGSYEEPREKQRSPVKLNQ